MAMSINEKLLFIWLLVVVGFGFVFRHFWLSTVYALSKVVALNLVFVAALAKLAAGLFGAHFFS
jgi:hypothetical protein